MWHHLNMQILSHIRSLSEISNRLLSVVLQLHWDVIRKRNDNVQNPVSYQIASEWMSIFDSWYDHTTWSFNLIASNEPDCVQLCVRCACRPECGIYSIVKPHSLSCLMTKMRVNLIACRQRESIFFFTPSMRVFFFHLYFTASLSFSTLLRIFRKDKKYSQAA